MPGSTFLFCLSVTPLCLPFPVFRFSFRYRLSFNFPFPPSRFPFTFCGSLSPTSQSLSQLPITHVHWAVMHVYMQAHTHTFNQTEWLHICRDSCYKKSHPLNATVLSLYHYWPTVASVSFFLSLFSTLSFSHLLFRRQKNTRKAWDRMRVEGKREWFCGLRRGDMRHG